MLDKHKNMSNQAFIAEPDSVGYESETEEEDQEEMEIRPSLVQSMELERQKVREKYESSYYSGFFLGKNEIPPVTDIYIARPIADAKYMKPRETSLFKRKRSRKASIPWTQTESDCLKNIVESYGTKGWQSIALTLDNYYHNGRTAAQCCMYFNSILVTCRFLYSHSELAQRWYRVINPCIDKGPWEPDEDDQLLMKYEEYNGSWCKIVKHFPHRTDTQCRRRFEKLVHINETMI